MIVMKFGGSSVRDGDRIRHVSTLVKAALDQRPLLVFSALGGTTDFLVEAGKAALNGEVKASELIEFHQQVCQDLNISADPLEPLFEEFKNLLKGVALLRELSPKSEDYLLSFGERLSVRIIASFLSEELHEARSFDAWEAGLVTSPEHGEAEVLEESYDQIGVFFEEFTSSYPYIPVVTGYVGKSKEGSITTLGRGGSDLTASVFGAALRVDEIQVWKDVDGILTTDPRIVASAKPVPAITYEEASELAYFGAKVLHPVAMQPAMKFGVPVRVKNSYKPTAPGTTITEKQEDIPPLVKALTCKRSVTVVDLVSSRMLGQHGFLAGAFEIFNRHRVSVDMLATSEVSLSLTIKKKNADHLDPVVEELSELAEVKIGNDKAILSIVGDVSRSSEILDNAFHVLADQDVNVQMISQGASKVNIGMVVEDSEVDRCLRSLHQHFFSGEA
jgi:aspartate kinase